MPYPDKIKMVKPSKAIMKIIKNTERLNKEFSMILQQRSDDYILFGYYKNHADYPTGALTSGVGIP
jgi:hypothetical protein